MSKPFAVRFELWSIAITPARVGVNSNNTEGRRLRVEKKLCAGVALLVLAAPMITAQAAVVSVDCSKKGASINSAIGKLDRSLSNTVNVTGNCTENILVNGHRDLTIAAQGAATLSSADVNFGTVEIIGSSRVTLSGLTINGGFNGVQCDDRSVCVLSGVNVVGGTGGGLALQKQSTADVIGGSIINSGGNGIGVFGASSVNVSPGPNNTPVVISGHTEPQFQSAYGIFAQDGSFVRVDGATITGNNNGAAGERGAVLKLLGTTITGNSGVGVSVRASTVQVTGAVTNNGSHGIRVRELAYLVFSGATDLTGNVGLYVRCDNVTSTTNPKSLVGSFVPTEEASKTNCPNPNP
jgi:hypothetical protein